MMLFSIAIPGYTGKKLAKLQTKARAATDARIGLMTETLTSVRIIKFFGLETAFLGKVKEKRDAELQLALKTRLYGTLFSWVISLLPVINMVRSAQQEAASTGVTNNT